VRISVQIEVEEVHRDIMGDWISRLKQQEETARCGRDQKRALQMREHDLIAEKGPYSWEKVVAQVERDIATLRMAFPEDPAKEIQFARCERGFTLERHSYPQVLLKARWVSEINGVGVETTVRTSAISERVTSPTKEEIRFSLTSENDIRMTFETTSSVIPESLSEPFIMKVLRHNLE
jgi:hypothetical protein